jgi:hypothetical protein
MPQSGQVFLNFEEKAKAVAILSVRVINLPGFSLIDSGSIDNTGLPIISPQMLNFEEVTVDHHAVTCA